MDIVSITPMSSFLVETNEPEYSTYCRDGGGGWSVLMGESWEPCYFREQELEDLFLKYVEINGVPTL